MNIQTLIEKYELKPHIEGGYASLLYEDAYSLDQKALPEGFKGSRPIWNAIYYLLPEGDSCIFHKIKMTEMWNFYLGGCLELFDISPDGVLKKIFLGNDLSLGHQLAYVFPANHWIAAKPAKGVEFSFVSCVTVPGFTFDDWEKLDKNELIKKYPRLKEEIEVI